MSVAMVEVPGCKSMTFSIYGIESEGLPQRFIEAELFSRKVRTVLTALKKADRVANGKSRPRHVYFVSELKTGSAVVGLTEFMTPLHPAIRPASSVDTFIECAQSLYRGEFDRAAQFDGLPSAIHAIAKGANDSFSHINLAPEAADPLRVDSFFEKQVERFMARKEVAETPKPPPFFRGTSHDAFDGTLKAVDLRGELWRGKLILTGSGIEIDCVIRGPSLEEVQKNLNMRVWAEGLAIYSEESGLPQRLEVSRMRPINTADDLRRWRGKLSPNDTRGDTESEWFDQ